MGMLLKRATPSIAWTLQTPTVGWPGYNGYIELESHAAADRILLYGVPDGSTSIYSSDLYSYNPATNVFTFIDGNGSLSNTCTDTSPVWPGDRHPVGQMCVDTLRNVLWIFAGVCGGNDWTDLWSIDLATGTATKHTPATTPAPRNSAAMIYSPDDDVIFLFGSDAGAQTHCNWVYCPSASRSAAQIAAGCAAAEDWTEVSVVGGTQPVGVQFPRMVYDTYNRKVIQFGGNTGGGVTQNQTWAYDIPTQTWTRKALSTLTPTLYSGPGSPPTFALAYVPAFRGVIYHQTHGSGAPRDWFYRYSTDTWQIIPSTGNGATVDAMAAYDSATGVLMTYSRTGAGGSPDIWHGVAS